jgi:hypothetical protein
MVLSFTCLAVAEVAGCGKSRSEPKQPYHSLPTPGILHHHLRPLWYDGGRTVHRYLVLSFLIIKAAVIACIGVSLHVLRRA